MKKIITALLLAAALGSSTLFFAPVVYAKTPSNVVRLPNPLDPKHKKNNRQEIFGLMQRVIKSVLGLVGSIALFMIVYGGFLWLTSAGRSAQVDKGKGALVWAGVGLAVVFGSAILVDLVIKALQKGGG